VPLYVLVIFLNLKIVQRYNFF